MSQSIYQWIMQGLVKPEQQQEALQLAGERPTASAWLVFSRNLLLLLGLLSLAFGVVFFFAFNWNEMGRMYKFAALQVLLVLSFVGYYFKSQSFWLSQALLLVAVIVLGALLALFGQTYQTGADPWQLFVTWALLITPLVLFSRSEVLWVFWAVLINTGLGLYMDINHSLIGAMYSGSGWFWSYLLVNFSILVLMELLSSQTTSAYLQKMLRVSKLRNRWSAQVLGLVVFYILTSVGMHSLWESASHRALNFVLYASLMTLAFVYYRFKAKDLLMLTAWLMSLIAFILAYLAYVVFEGLDEGALLLMAICLIGMTTFAVQWIKQTHEVFKAEVSS